MAKEVFFTLPKGLKQSEIDCDPEDLTSFQSCDDYLATVMLERERMSNDERHRLARSPTKSPKKQQHTITKTERTISQKISISQDRVHGVKQAVERCILHINSLKIIPATEEEMSVILSDRNIAHTDPQELLSELEKMETWLLEDFKMMTNEKISTRIFTLLVRLLSVQNYRAEHHLCAMMRSLAKILSSNYVELNECNDAVGCLQVLAIIFHDCLDQRDLFDF
jgi:hypothetical protein